ncbi:MAG: hypothetical protein K6G76_01610 [Lachnospiraceae bacterium]|nr:hypothetical protein [Lachnospiraceae bacterium]
MTDKIRQYMRVVLTLCLMTVLVFMPDIYAKAGKNSTKIIKENDKFKVEAEYGLGGMILYDYPMQVKVTIESAEDFSGIIRLMPYAEYGEKFVARGKRISIAAGETKTFMLTMDTPSNSSAVKLALLNEKDKVVYEERSNLSIQNAGTTTLVGVLSDDYSGLGYFNGVSVDVGGYSNVISTIELTKDSFPDDASVLSSMSYIVVDNFDTSTLSKEQYAALKEWVKNGGVLVLSLGSHYQTVLSGIGDDFVSGTVGSVTEKTLTWYGVEEDFVLENVESVGFVLNDGENLTHFVSDGAAATVSYGMGNVVVLSYALSMEPFSTYARRTDVISLMVKNTVNSAYMSMINGYTYNRRMNTGSELAKLSGTNKVPSAILYGLLLVIYVVLVGPILYLILKKKNKREKIWIAIPIVSLVFTGVIYLTSFIYRVNKPLVNTFSYIDVTADSAVEETFVNVICPRAKRYNFALSDKYSDFQCSVYSYDYSLFGNRTNNDQDYNFMYVDNGAGGEIQFNAGSTFDSYDFGVKRVLDADAGSFSLDLDCSTTALSGSVTNNTAYDLKDVVINYENRFYLAGDLKKGETVTIDPSKVQQSYGYGFFTDQLTTNAFGNKQLNIDSNIENTLDYAAYNQGCVWGTIDSYSSQVFEGDKYKYSGCAVVIQQYNQSYSDVSGAFCPNINTLMSDVMGDCDTQVGMMYNNEAVITYSFAGFGTVESLVIDTSKVDTTLNIADVYAYNYQTDTYDLIFENGDTLSSGQLRPYIEGGMLKLKYERPLEDNGDPQYYDTALPRISAIGSGK